MALESLVNLGLDAANTAAPALPGGAFLVGGLSLLTGLLLKRPGEDKRVFAEEKDSYNAGIEEGKRLVREAFRLGQHALPASAPGPYDFVVVVRPHEPLTLDQYRAAFGSAVRHLHSTWQKRINRRTTAADRASPRED